MELSIVEGGRGMNDKDVIYRQTVLDLPIKRDMSAEPERKKGKWIFIHPLQADDEGAYICSNCHRGDWDIKPTDKYCKFCEMEMDIYER